MQVKVYLENGETIDDAEELITKAFHGKHDQNHEEGFEDPLIQQLYEKMDNEFRNIVLLKGFHKMLEVLLTDVPD